MLIVCAQVQQDCKLGCASCSLRDRQKTRLQLQKDQIRKKKVYTNEESTIKPGCRPGHMVCFLEKDIVLGESHLYNDSRQTLDRSLVCNDMLVLYLGLSCQPGTSLHISHLRHANYLPADLELQLTDGGMRLMKHLDSSFSLLNLERESLLRCSCRIRSMRPNWSHCRQRTSHCSLPWTARTE